MRLHHTILLLSLACLALTARAQQDDIIMDDEEEDAAIDDAGFEDPAMMGDEDDEETAEEGLKVPKEERVCYTMLQSADYSTQGRTSPELRCCISVGRMASVVLWPLWWQNCKLDIMDSVRN